MTVGQHKCLYICTMNLEQSTADKIRTARIAAGMTQKELADKLQYTPQAIGMIEGGKRNLGLKTLESVAEVLNCDVSILLKKRANKRK